MGLLDAFGGSDPQTQGLLAAAANMLQASGPSLMPRSFGQVAGAGINGFQQGREQALQQQREQMQMQMLQQQVAQATRRNNLVNDALERRFGRGAQQQPSQDPMGAQVPQVQQGPALGSTDSDGRTISTPYFYAPADAAPKAPAPMSAGSSAIGSPSLNVPDDAMLWSFAGFPDLGKMVNERTMPTNEVKNALQLGIPLNTLRDAQLAELDTKGVMNVKPEGTLFKNGKAIFTAPNADGQFTTWDNQGNPTSTLVPNATNVVRDINYAKGSAKAMLTPRQAVDPVTGKRVFTNDFIAANGGFDPNAPKWTGGTLSDADLGALKQGAATGNKDAIDTLSAYGRAQGSGGALVPDYQPGYEDSQKVLGTKAANRFGSLIDQASDSPTRVNVYDNILNLSREGVASGPGQAWINKVKGYVANTPGLSSVSGKWQNDVVGAQELSKFMYQNAQRNWQAAGGTGTDSQLEAFTKANPNDTMFPAALQKMAEWGKAGELALQGKANAAQAFKDKNGGNVANMDQFERSWRNNFDPVLFQLKTMSPQDASTYVANLKKTNPNAYSNLMMKAQALKNIGGL